MLNATEFGKRKLALVKILKKMSPEGENIILFLPTPLALTGFQMIKELDILQSETNCDVLIL